MAERGVRVVFKPENSREQSASRGTRLTVFVPEKSVFHMARNSSTSGTAALRGMIRLLRQRLPANWRLSEAAHQERHAALIIRSPDSRVAHLRVVWSRRIEPKDVARIVPPHRQRPRATNVLVGGPFLSLRTRELLAAAGASYFDATGNLRLALERPAVFLEAQGADKDPAREPRPLASLKGPAAGRVVRALCDFRPPYGVRELAARCTAAPASVSRVVGLLERDAIVVREDGGAIVSVDWPALLRRWTHDYQLTSSNATMMLLEPRGGDAFVDKLRRFRHRYAVSGSLAAARKTPVAVPHVAIAYVDDPIAAAQAMGLRPGERGANVLLAAPYDSVVFDRAWPDEGATYAALSQVAADLLSSPGRGPAEAADLIAWMRANETSWRT